jgi:pimeloyl-ACP methyl ester carboxylesterase
MGGAIAQLIAREHRDVVSGLVLSATAQHWQEPEAQRLFRRMVAFGLALSLAPRASWRSSFRRVGMRESRETAWLRSELLRHSVSDLIEAGRELGRFDSRPWLGAVSVPAAVVVTTRDQAVAPAKQRELAAALRASVFESPINHLQVAARARDYNPALLAALAAVGKTEGVTGA